MIVVLMLCGGTGIAAATPSSTVDTSSDYTLDTDRFQYEGSESCTLNEFRLASIFTTYGIEAPDSLSHCIEDDSSLIDRDEISEIRPDEAGSDTGTTPETDDSRSDESIDENSSSEDTETGSGEDGVGDTSDPSDGTETDESESSGDDESDLEDGDTDEATDNTGSDGIQESEGDDLDIVAVERQIHEQINEERVARGLNELEFDTQLQSIARNHSQDMADRGYFSHTDPDGDNFADRYADAGYECRVGGEGGTYYTGGENIAQTWYDTPVRTGDGTNTYTTESELADAIVTQWMNSAGHKENILATQWEHEGIGVSVTDDGKVYATQNFC